MSEVKKKSNKRPNRELYKKAQAKLISSLVYSDEDISDIFEIVAPDDFEEPQYEMIYNSIIDLSRKGESTDVVSIAHSLESVGLLDDVGGVKELYTIREHGRKAVLQTPISVYAKIVKESSAKNKLNNLLEEYKEFFKDDSGTSAAEALSEIQSNLNEHLYKLSNDSSIVEVSELSRDYLELLDERRVLAEENAELADGLMGIPSLLPSMNKYTTGWRENQMITVGAKTGVGKSVYAINSAVGAVQANKSVMFFSLEMDSSAIQDRIVSSVTSIPMNELKRGHITDEQKNILSEALEELKLSNLTIDADPKQTIDSIRAKCLKKAQSPEGLDMVIIDYLQLITPTGRYNSRQEQVADISRNVKLLAKQLQIPIMVLVQLNRASDDDDELPTVDNIRESGAIAQDSDIVILLHREKTLDDELPPTLVILAKQRNGVAGKVIRCHSQLECSIFREIVSRKDHNDEFSDDELDDFEDELKEDMDEFDFDDFDQNELEDF